MSVKERLRIFIKSQNLTVNMFEASINTSNGYVNSISKSIGLDKLGAIIEKYPNLNIEWLLIGRGEMIKSLNQTETQTNNDREIIETLKELLQAKNEQIELLKEKNITLANDKSKPTKTH